MGVIVMNFSTNDIKIYIESMAQKDCIYLVLLLAFLIVLIASISLRVFTKPFTNVVYSIDRLNRRLYGRGSITSKDIMK